MFFMLYTASFVLFFFNVPSSSFFFNDTATTEIYTLSLHDALPICQVGGPRAHAARDDHVAQANSGVHVARHDPQARPAADPIHGREPEPHHEPTPVQAEEGLRERLEVVAIEEQTADAGEGNEGEQLQTAAEQSRGQR